MAGFPGLFFHSALGLMLEKGLSAGDYLFNLCSQRLKAEAICTTLFSPPGLAVTPHGGLTPWTPGHWASPNRMVMGLYPTAHLDFSTWSWFPARAKRPGMGKMWAPPACTNLGVKGLAHAPVCLSVVDLIQVQTSKASPCPQGPWFHLEQDQPGPDMLVQPDAGAHSQGRAVGP